MSYLDDASLVMIPSGYKDGKLYSVKPSDGAGDFTFTRGSNLAATRVNEDGLVEKGRENLLLQSNQFDTTWTNVGTTDTGGQSGYDGSSDAWLLTKTAANGYIFQSISLSGVNTISIYAKAGNSDFMVIASGPAAKWYNLSNGTLGTTSGAIIDAQIESVGAGWYRCTYTLNASLSNVRFYPSNADGLTSGTSGSIYIQDAQLEVGLVATDYIETGATTAQAGILEDMPRLDYSGGATCPSLLLEPSRTQLVGQSEYFDGSYWPKADVVVTNNAAISPDGKLNASKLIASATNANHLLNKPGFLGITSGQSYTFSIFAKAAEYDFVRLQFQTGPFPVNYANFDLTNGTIGLNTGTTDTKIESFGNGWYKCIMVVTATSTANSGFQPFVLDSDRTGTSPSYLGDGTSGIYIWGAQCEQASYATSYIPTYGTSVTRGADACTNSTGGVSQTEGTIFIDYKDSPNKDVLFACSTSAALITNNIRLSHNQLYIRNSTGNLVVGSVTLPDEGKLAIKYDTNGVKIFSNGNSTPIFTNSTSIFLDGSVDFVRIGSRVNNLNIEEFNVDQFLIFTTALSDAECVTLTT